jgi:hypothetical protein
MSESPKARLLFEYSRDEEGTYTGSVAVLDGITGQSQRPPLYVVVTQPEWVKFVVETIRHHREIDSVAFTLAKSDKSKYQYQLDHRTVDKIKDETTVVEDFIL